MKKLLDLTQLKMAQSAFHQALDYAVGLEENQDDYAFKAARGNLIQSFEFAFEVSWKMMKRYVDKTIGPGDEKIKTHKDLFRIAAQRELIDDVYPWLDYQDARNQTSHSYNEEVAAEVYRITKQFRNDLDVFVEKIGSLV